MSHLMPALSGDVSRILLFLKAVWYGRLEEILSEFLLTVKNLLFAPGWPIPSRSWVVIWCTSPICRAHSRAICSFERCSPMK